LSAILCSEIVTKQKENRNMDTAFTGKGSGKAGFYMLYQQHTSTLRVL
jgi:hypothetical protein